MICYCSLAGTKACECCSNNPNAKGILQPYFDSKTVTLTDEGIHNYSYSAKKRIHKPIQRYLCPNCSNIVYKDDKFCSQCGDRLDWSDITD